MKMNFYRGKKQNPDLEGHIKLDYGPSKRHFPKLGWYLILVLAASPILYFLLVSSYGFWNIQAPGYVSFQTLTIRAPGNTLVKQLWVKSGDRVKATGPLIELWDPRLAEQEQLIAEQYKDLSNNTPESSKEILVHLSQSLALAENEVSFYSQQFSKMKSLYDEQELGLPEYNSAQESLIRARYRVQELKVAMAKEHEQHNRDLSDENSYLKKKEFLRLQLDALHAQMAALSISAPSAGKVIDTYVLPGQYTTLGENLLLMTRSTAPDITAYLDPKYIEYATLEHPVSIYFSNGDTRLGRVSSEPKLTKKLPADMNSNLGVSAPLKLLVHIKPDQALSKQQGIEGLPVTIRFN